MTSWVQVVASGILGFALGILADAISVRMLIRRGLIQTPNASVRRLVAIGGAFGFALIPLRLSLLEWPLAIGVGFVLMSLSSCDLRARVLPNDLILLLTSTLLLRAVLVGKLSQYMLGAFAGMAALLLPALIVSIMTGKSGLGAGDVKLITAIGLCIGWPGVIGAVMWGIFCGGLGTLMLVLIGRVKINQPVAYGPYLVAGSWLFWMLGRDMLLSLY